MTEIETYDIRQAGSIKVFFKVFDGDVTSIIVGNRAVSTDGGYQFYVDDYVADQIDKCEMYLDGLTPKLKLQEGETLEVPEKSEKEKEIERLQFELEVLKNEPN